jgi:Glycosyl hydrolases family 38 N-terminal domain
VFTIYVIQSAHTDIGYTHPQEQIMHMYVEYYDKVLELCRATEHLAEPHRFKWTCETSWQVKNYLAARPECQDEFIHFVKNGQIEITASYFHFTDLIDVDAYRRSLDWVATFCADHDLPLRTAMHCDINGWPWALPELLTERGVKLFLSQVHIDSATDPLGPRGSVHYHWLSEQASWLRPGDLQTRIPQAFWWQGPTGQRILHWLGEHYHLGNVLGLSGHKSFYAEKSRYFWEVDRETVDDLYAVAQHQVPPFVQHLQKHGYPYDSLLISTSGYFVDNSAPDGRWCELAARWNSERTDIQLHVSTLSEWYDQLLTLDKGNWPVYEAAWPDYWAHGLGTMTARIAQARRTQRQRPQIVELVQSTGSTSAQQALDIALEQERFSLEHTFDAWKTTAVPWDAANDFLQGAKELTFHRAQLYYEEAASTALRTLSVPDGQQPLLYLWNSAPGNATRLIYFGADDAVLDATTQVLVTPDGTSCPFQRSSHEKDRPNFVARLPLSQPGLNALRLATRESSARRSIDHENILRTAAWQLEIDPATGGLLSLFDQRSKHEWVDKESEHSFGQLVHETVTHPLGRQAVSNLAHLVKHGVASDEAQRELGSTDVFAHASPTLNGAAIYTAGPVFDAVSMQGEFVPGTVEIAWRAYHALPLVELVLDWDKRWSELPEAAYVAFPFDAPDGRLLLETAGGFFQPGLHKPGGQLPGTDSTYYTIQRAAQISTPDRGGLLWLPLDAPLVMPQSIDFSRWDIDEWSWNGFLASMPVNHYWHTNFPRSQRGYIRLRYWFFPLPDLNSVETTLQQLLPLDALGWR